MRFNSLRLTPWCVLLLAAWLLGTGCEKFGGRGGIKFKAAAPNAELTKAVWGEDVGSKEHGTQRIVWENGDIIRLTSNFAQSEAGDHSFDYAVTNVDPGSEEKYSYGRLSPVLSQTGLMWDETKTRAEHKFWGVYPARDIAISGDEARISGDIPEDGLLMVSYLDSAPESAVSLYFYPAFTSFRLKITNGTGVPVTVNTISISSGDPLQGTFTAKIADGGVTDVQIQNPGPGPGPGPDPEQVVIWEGQLTQEGGIGTHDAFQEAQVGQWLRIYFKRTADSWYYLKPFGGANGWDTLLSGNGFLNQSIFPVDKDVETYYEIPITEEILSKIYVPDQPDWAKGWTYAMRIQLDGCTVTKVTYGGTPGATKASAGTKASANMSQLTNDVGVGLEDTAEMTDFSNFIVLPRDINDLKLTVNYTAEGQGTFTKSMTLNDYVFNAGKQYRLVGIILPDALDIVDITVVSNGQVFHTGRDTWRF